MIRFNHQRKDGAQSPEGDVYMITNITKELDLVFDYVMDETNFKRAFLKNNKNVVVYSYNTHKYYVIYDFTTKHFSAYINKNAFVERR